MYVIRERDPELCVVCGESKELRYGHCFDCATPDVFDQVSADIAGAGDVLLVQDTLAEPFGVQRIR